MSIIIDLYLCILYVGYFIVYCLTVIWFMSFAVCYVSLTAFMFFVIQCMLLFFVCLFCFLVCALCVFISFCVLFSPSVYSCLFYICVQVDNCHLVETHLP
jgi:hypothetical protein